MESKQSSTEDFSSAKAVLLGALAPGVNGPTWNTLKISFLMLGLCLAAMLGLAFSSSDSALVLHVTFLVLITGTLFLLLTRILEMPYKFLIDHPGASFSTWIGSMVSQVHGSSEMIDFLQRQGSSQSNIKCMRLA